MSFAFSRFLNCFLNELQLWGPGAVIPLERSGKWWNPKFQSVMDVSSRFGVCVRSPRAWCHLHNRITFQWRKKREREERETHMSNASATIRETVYNYLFVCSSSRWRWWVCCLPPPPSLSLYVLAPGCVKHTVFESESVWWQLRSH